MELRPDYKQTEVGVIPSGWMVKRLGDVANVDPENLGSNTSPYYAFNYISLEDVDLGMLRGYSDEMFSTAPSRARRKLQKGDILVSTVRPNLKSHLLFNIDAPHWVCSTGFSVVRCWKGIAHPRFVFFHLFEHAISRQVEMLLTGSNYPAINGGDVRALQIPLPEYDEQTAIAAALSDVDTLIGALDRLIAKKRDLKQATMQQLLTGQTRLPGFSKAWEFKRIVDFTDCTAGGTPSTAVTAYWGGSIRWMSSGELNLKTVDEVEGRITELGLKNSSTKIVPAKCVLVGLAGQGKTRGTVAMNTVELCTNQSIAAIYPNPTFDSAYLYYNLESRYDELRSLSTGDGGRGGLNLTIIRSIVVPFPKTKEQTAIATVLSDMDAELATLEARRGKTRALKQGMMQELLTGRIRLM